MNPEGPGRSWPSQEDILQQCLPRLFRHISVLHSFIRSKTPLLGLTQFLQFRPLGTFVSYLPEIP